MSDFILKKRKLLNTCQYLEARKWAAIPGIRVNDSFFENQIIPSMEAIIEALKYLGVDYYSIPKQTKWYEFWKNEHELRLKEAINRIHTAAEQPYL